MHTSQQNFQNCALAQSALRLGSIFSDNFQLLSSLRNSSSHLESRRPRRRSIEIAKRNWIDEIMGGFYSNITLKGPDQAAVAEALSGRVAIVSPQVNGCIVAFDAIWDKQDTNAIGKLLPDLSRKLQCPVWAILVHDDDVFYYQLYVKGSPVDEYNSNPGYFDFGSSGEPAGPKGGDAKKLGAAFGSDKFQEVEGILRKRAGSQEGYVFETERHADLLKILKLPTYAIGKAYASFERGEYPDGLTPEQMLRSS